MSGLKDLLENSTTCSDPWASMPKEKGPSLEDLQRFKEAYKPLKPQFDKIVVDDFAFKAIKNYTGAIEGTPVKSFLGMTLIQREDLLPEGFHAIFISGQKIVAMWVDDEIRIFPDVASD